MTADGDINDEVVKEASLDIYQATSTSKSTLESEVPTTAVDDALDTVYTAAPSIYSSIANAGLSQISSDWLYDQSFSGGTATPATTADATHLPHHICDSTLMNMETRTFKQLGNSFCKNIDLGKKTNKELTTADVGSSTFPGYKFDLGWEPKQGTTFFLSLHPLTYCRRVW